MIVQKLLYYGRCIVYQITQLADYQRFFFALLFNIHAKSYSLLHLFFLMECQAIAGDAIVYELGTHLSHDGSSFFLQATPLKFSSYSMASLVQVSLPSYLYLCTISRVVIFTKIVGAKIQLTQLAPLAMLQKGLVIIFPFFPIQFDRHF